MKPMITTAFAALLLATAFPTTAAASVIPPIPLPLAALDELNELTVAPESSGDGYSREKFRHWITVSGTCDTRETVLKRDGEHVQANSECEATSGSWHSAYDGATIRDPKALEIDHMVPPQEAWRSGAAGWTAKRREEFANDLTSPQLWVVTAKYHRLKGAKDPAEWGPPLESFRCDYATAWIAVKHTYRLTVDQAERNALDEMLDHC
jgi:hypothetical protein